MKKRIVLGIMLLTASGMNAISSGQSRPSQGVETETLQRLHITKNPKLHRVLTEHITKSPELHRVLTEHITKSPELVRVLREQLTKNPELHRVLREQLITPSSNQTLSSSLTALPMTRKLSHVDAKKALKTIEQQVRVLRTFVNQNPSKTYGSTFQNAVNKVIPAWEHHLYEQHDYDDEKIDF